MEWGKRKRKANWNIIVDCQCTTNDHMRIVRQRERTYFCRRLVHFYSFKIIRSFWKVFGGARVFKYENRIKYKVLWASQSELVKTLHKRNILKDLRIFTKKKKRKYLVKWKKKKTIFCYFGLLRIIFCGILCLTGEEEKENLKTKHLSKCVEKTIKLNWD